MKKLISFILFFALFSANSQISNTDIHSKYWFYKWRFNNDFIKIGEQPGESLPITTRLGQKGPDWTFDYLQWADTPLNLAIYISVLATEYKLLELNNRTIDIEKTKTELYYAIEALKRLDDFAEEKTPFYQNNPLTGFGLLARDDVPIDFLDRPYYGPGSSDPKTNKDHFNQSFTQLACNNSIEKISSDHITEINDPNHEDNESRNLYSRDHAIYVLMAMMYVRESFPVVANFQTVSKLYGTQTQYCFQCEANLLLDNILRYIKYNYPNHPSLVNWRIKNPYGNGLNGTGALQDIAFPLAQIHNRISGASEVFPHHGFPTGFHTPWSSTIANITWQSYKLRFNPAYATDITNGPDHGIENRHMSCTLANITDSWGNDVYVPGLISVFNSTTQNNLYEVAAEENWEEWQLMSWDYLNHKNLKDNDIDQIFNSTYNSLELASCSGPYYFASDQEYNAPLEAVYNSARDGYGTFGGRFCTPNRLKDAAQDQAWGSQNWQGFYNGLDYMLMHNLYYLTSGEQLPEYQDMVNRYVGDDFGQNYISSNPNRREAFYSIKADNTIEENVTMTYRAGYEITLEPGFHIQNGSNTHIYVDPFSCRNEGYRNGYINDENITGEEYIYGFRESLPFKNHHYTTSESYIKEDEPSSNFPDELDYSSQMLSENLSFIVYPNPTNGLVNINLTHRLDTKINIDVFNVMGKLVESKQVNGSDLIELDFTNKESGIYIIKINDGITVASKKLVVK